MEARNTINMNAKRLLMQMIETLKKSKKEDLVNIGIERFAEKIIEQGILAINVKTSSVPNEPEAQDKPNNTIIDSILNIFKPKTPVQERTIQDTFPIGTSKIGGHPDLPDNFSWPYNNGQPLSLVAQFNLNDIKDYDLNNQLPETGILHFFYDNEEMPWGGHKEDKTGWKVIYTEETKNLKRITHPDFQKNDYYFKPCKLSFETLLSLPSFERFINNPAIELDEEEEEKYSNYFNKSISQRDCHQLLGYPIPIQNDNMERYCVLNMDIISTEEPLEKDLKEWIILFQIDSDKHAGMMWGDCGRLFFWIKKDDLKNKNFDNVWMILECC